MNKNLLICGGVINFLLAGFHLAFWKIFDWPDSLLSLSPMNLGIMQVINIHLAFVVFVFAYVSIFHHRELLSTKKRSEEPEKKMATGLPDAALAHTAPFQIIESELSLTDITNKCVSHSLSDYGDASAANEAAAASDARILVYYRRSLSVSSRSYSSFFLPPVTLAAILAASLAER